MSFSFAAARSAIMAGLFADTDLAERPEFFLIKPKNMNFHAQNAKM